MAVLEPYRGDYYLWHYLPSIPAAVIFLLIFLGCTFALSWMTWKAKVKFTIPFAVGTFFEVIGYGARAGAHNNTASVFKYALQNAFTLLGPALMAATIYMMFGRLARLMHAENHSIVRVSLLTKIFVTFDVLSFLVQGSSAGLMVMDNMANVGKAMVILGLLIQIIAFGLFMVTSAIFHKRVAGDLMLKSMAMDIPWVRLMRLMYAISFMIMVRSIFRLVEFSQGMDGWLMRREWPLYVLDSVPMALSSVLMVVYFPRELQQAVVR